VDTGVQHDIEKVLKWTDPVIIIIYGVVIKTIILKPPSRGLEIVYYLVGEAKYTLSMKDVHVYLFCIDVAFTAAPNEEHFH